MCGLAAFFSRNALSISVYYHTVAIIGYSEFWSHNALLRGIGPKNVILLHGCIISCDSVRWLRGPLPLLFLNSTPATRRIVCYARKVA